MEDSEGVQAATGAADRVSDEAVGREHRRGRKTISTKSIYGLCRDERRRISSVEGPSRPVAITAIPVVTTMTAAIAPGETAALPPVYSAELAIALTVVFPQAEIATDGQPPHASGMV